MDDDDDDEKDDYHHEELIIMKKMNEHNEIVRIEKWLLLRWSWDEWKDVEEDKDDVM